MTLTLTIRSDVDTGGHTYYGPAIEDAIAERLDPDGPRRRLARLNELAGPHTTETCDICRVSAGFRQLRAAGTESASAHLRQRAAEMRADVKADREAQLRLGHAYVDEPHTLAITHALRRKLRALNTVALRVPARRLPNLLEWLTDEQEHYELLALEGAKPFHDQARTLALAHSIAADIVRERMMQ